MCQFAGSGELPLLSGSPEFDGQPDKRVGYKGQAGSVEMWNWQVKGETSRGETAGSAP